MDVNNRSSAIANTILLILENDPYWAARMKEEAFNFWTPRWMKHAGPGERHAWVRENFAQHLKREFTDIFERLIQSEQKWVPVPYFPDRDDIHRKQDRRRGEAWLMQELVSTLVGHALSQCDWDAQAHALLLHVEEYFETHEGKGGPV